MLTAAQRKDIVALQRKKGRDEQGQFVVEGPKMVAELIASGWKVERIVAVESWAADTPPGRPVHIVSADELARVSAMETPNQVLAVARLPAPRPPPTRPAGLVLALDGVQDPGNLGTILRIADWFAAAEVVCSPDCADRFNPKAVQASMGSLFRVRVSVAPLPGWLDALPAETTVAGALLEGENLFAASLPSDAVLVLGGEGRGLSPAVEQRIRHRLTIPRFGGAESLNVAAAAALFCSEWRREGRLQAPAPPEKQKGPTSADKGLRL